MRERDNMLIVVPNVREATGACITMDPARADGFPKGWVVSDRAPLSWSDDGKRVFFGAMPQKAAQDTSRRRASTDSVADVDIWRTDDERIQSQQMVRAEQDRNFTFRESFDVAGGKYVQLSDCTMRELEMAEDGRWAIGRDTRGYVSDYKRPAADIYKVNTATGERTLLLKNQLTGQFVFGISPNGKNFLYWKDNKYQSYDLDAGTTKTIGSGAPSFVDTEFDHPGPKPSYGIAGYSTDGKGVIAHAKYDEWFVPVDGSAPKSLTNGAKDEIRFRYVRTEPLPSVPGDSAAGGLWWRPRWAWWSRGSGDRSVEARHLRGLRRVDEEGWLLRAGGWEAQAARLRRRGVQQSREGGEGRQVSLHAPDICRVPRSARVGPDVRRCEEDHRRQSAAVGVRVGPTVLFDYRIKDGTKLQGMMALPDDYQPGEKRPMIVSFYEKNSQNLNRYRAPSFAHGHGRARWRR